MATGFEDAIGTLAKRSGDVGPSLATEEATKNALVMPFLQALGYDVFNPHVVIPEFTADHGIKKGEKVDYAIKKGDAIIILVECKGFGVDLDNVGASQLFRYFSVTSANISILTNGKEYRFYSDLDTKNKMDSRPFFTFDLSSVTTAAIQELAKFQAERFEISSILETANDLKYTNLIKSEIVKELDGPSDEFVEMLARRVYTGRLTAGVRDWLKALTAQAMRNTVREMVNRRLSDAIERPEPRPIPADSSLKAMPLEDLGDVVTTEEEIEAFQLIRAILRQHIGVERITMRDAKSYCAILLDNNNRKPIARLYLDGKKKRIGVFKSKSESKIDLECIDDIFKYAEHLREALLDYEVG